MSTTTRRRPALSRWAALLRQRFPTLSSSQAFGLALWSIGIVLARSASLHAVVLALVCWLPLNPLSPRKRLQEWYLEAAAKKGRGTGHTGQHRRDWNPRTTAAFLFRWIVEDWPNHQLVLALDPTHFEDRFTVLAISVLYRSCAVPVMWPVLSGGAPEAWEPHWERMLKELATLVPGGWQVLVQTDRGMYSPRLFRRLVGLGWRPFLRIRAQGRASAHSLQGVANKALAISFQASTKTQILELQRLVKPVRWPWRPGVLAADRDQEVAGFEPVATAQQPNAGLGCRGVQE